TAEEWSLCAEPYTLPTLAHSVIVDRAPPAPDLLQAAVEQRTRAARALPGDGPTVTERSIEIVIGRLLTDEDFRETFLGNPELALGELDERGTRLSHTEIAALLAVDPACWRRVAEQIDPRLQKASLKRRRAITDES